MSIPSGPVLYFPEDCNHMCMRIHPSVPARSVADSADHALARPDQFSFGTSTPLEFMTAAQFMKESGVRMVRVPHKGGVQMIPDLVEGRLQVGFTPPGVGTAQSEHRLPTPAGMTGTVRKRTEQRVMLA